MFEHFGVAAIDVAVLFLTTHFEDVLEVVDLVGEGVVSEDVFQQVVLEGVELVEACDAFVGGVAFGEVVFVVDHEVAVVEVLEVFEAVFVGDADGVAGGLDGAVVEADVVAEVGGYAVAFFLLAAGLFLGAAASGFAFGLDALLFQAAVFDAEAPHHVGEDAQAVLVDGIVGQDGVGVEPDEAVAELVVVLDGGECFLCTGANGDAEVGQVDIVLRLLVEVAEHGGGVVDPRCVEPIVAQELGDAEDGGGVQF